MNATVLSIGTELLFGQIVNTNAAYISQNLQLLGINVMYHNTVGDNPARLRETLEKAIEETDLVITTGGLGPTQDDLTKEIICETMGFELEFHEPSMEIMRNLFDKLGREMTENNIKQAYLPKGGHPFTNHVGTAPGFAVEKNGKIVMAFPGPPRELKYLFEKYAIPYLENVSDSVIRYKILRLFGIGESSLETALEDLINDQTDPTIATYAKEGEVAIRIASKRKTAKEADQAVSDMIDKVHKIVGKHIYSDDDVDLNETVGRKLIENNITLASAESCTGGMFAKRITDVAGISKVYNRGFVTYTNESKSEEIGVSPETLEKYGAVSEETALEMAEGVRLTSGTDMGISVTGIAGPDGGTEEKPVGLCYIAVSFGGENVVRKVMTRDRGRLWNRNYFCFAMLGFINDVIDEKYKK